MREIWPQEIIWYNSIRELLKVFKISNIRILLRSSIFQDLEPKRPHLVANSLQIRKQVLKERRFFSKKEASTSIKPNQKGMQDHTSSRLSNSLLSFLPFLFSISIFFIYFILVALGHVQGFILKENFCEGEVVKM